MRRERMEIQNAKRALSMGLSLLLVASSMNLSIISHAMDANAARIVDFDALGDDVAVQELPVGASLEDVNLPNTLKATVETVEEVEAKKAVEKQAEEPAVEPEEIVEEEPIQESVEDTDAIDSEDTMAEDADDEQPTDSTEESEDETKAEEADSVEQEEATEPEASAEEPTAEETPTAETSEPAEEPQSTEESVDTGLIDILFPAMVAKAAEFDEDNSSPVAGAIEAAMPETEYETVIEEQTLHSEITIENVEWKLADGEEFDTSKEASYVFEPSFEADYVVATTVPTIRVNIVNTDLKAAFEKSQVVDGVRITVKADAGVFPEGAELFVEKVYGADLQAVEAAVEEERADEKNKVESYTFDIKVLDKEGNEIEPDNSKGQVKVSFTLEEVADVNLETDVYHVKGEVGDLSVDKLEATEVAETTVEAVTDGFSFYTVEFTYNNLQYVMNGDTTVALSEILNAVGLSGEVTAATSDAPELVSVENTENGWMVIAKQAFSTDQKLTVTIGGNEYVIVVTDDNSHHAGWTEWTTSNSLPTVAGNYYLSSDVTLSNTWAVPSGETSLCLNGKTITGSGNGIVIEIGSGSILNLYDCSGSAGKITGGNAITPTANSGGGVYINNGSLNMYGGTISGNTAKYGGGVCVNGSSGIFNMRGGVIKENTANTTTGGVYVKSSSKFNLFDGEISDNTGSGVGIANMSTVTMSGGTISINRASQTNYNNGGGVHNGSGTFTMTGGTISGNTATGNGGGVNNEDTFTMTGGIISGNTATTNGGGVYQKTYYTYMKISGNPVIAGNNVNSNSNNVCLNTNCKIKITGALTENASIGVTMTSVTGTFTNGYNTYNANKAPSTYFSSDNGSYDVCYDSANEAQVAETYTVTFNANGHGVAPANQDVASGGKITKPSDPTDQVYTFAGWYKEAECTNAWNFETDTVTAATTLYAKWVEVTKYPIYVGGIQLDENNLTVNGTTGTATYDPATQTLTLNNYSSSTGYNYSNNYSAVIYSKEGLTINLIGNNKLIAETTEGNNAISMAEWKPLTIKGTGSLEAVGYNAIGLKSDLKIEGGTLNITGAYYGINNNSSGAESIVISGGNITVKGGLAGLGINYSIAITGGTVYAEATGDNGKAINQDIKLGEDVTASQSDDGNTWADIDRSENIAGYYRVNKKIAKFGPKQVTGEAATSMGALPAGQETAIDTSENPQVSDSLDAQAKRLAGELGDNIELNLIVTPEGQSKATESDIVKNDGQMDNAIKNQFKDEGAVTVDVLAIDIQQIINSSEITALTETDEVIEIAIGYNFTGKYDPIVVRKHDNSTQIFTALSSRPSGNYQDGTFYADVANNKIYIYSKYFSQYVIAYSTEEGNAQNRESGSSEPSDSSEETGELEESSSSGSSSSSSSSSAKTYPKTVPVYRLFNSITSEHLYTTNVGERDYLMNDKANGWTDEGIAWHSAPKSGKPVYRLFDVKNGGHVYTVDANERSAYIANGYTDEGIAWYASDKLGRKVYKLTNKKTGKILYTILKDEADILTKNGFDCEEAGFFAY